LKKPPNGKSGDVPTVMELALMPVEQRRAHLPVQPADTPLSAEDLAWVETDGDGEQDEP
jgi:hypothetical protein